MSSLASKEPTADLALIGYHKPHRSSGPMFKLTEQSEKVLIVGAGAGQTLFLHKGSQGAAANFDARPPGVELVELHCL